MEDMNISNRKPQWKDGIYKVSSGQLKRILRPKEYEAIRHNINPDAQGFFKKFETTKGNMQRWLNFLLFSGMRFSEAYRFKLNDGMYNGKPLFNPERHSLWMPKDLFGDVGKQKVVNAERVLWLSNDGVYYTKRFLEHASIPLSRHTRMRIDIRNFELVLNAMLKDSADMIGLPKRTFTITRKEKIKDMWGNPVMDENGKPKYRKVNVPLREETSGVITRSLRATWESYLTAMYMHDPLAVLNITASMGHTVETSQAYYVISGQFDSDDLKDIELFTRGWGIHAPKEIEQNNAENKERESN